MEGEKEEHPEQDETTAPASSAIPEIQPSQPSQSSQMPEGVEIVNGNYVFKDKEGISYEWDPLKQAWFPMWQDELITSQQSAYGSWQPEEAADPVPSAAARPGASNPNKRKAPEKDEPKKPSEVIYINGLPLDATIDEVKTYFEKCGIIKIDFETEQPKIKLYTDDKGNPKGDARLSYLKPESVKLAITLLDDSEIRPGFKITVAEAQFENKGDALKKKKKVDKKLVKQRMMKLEKKLQWYDEGPGAKAKKYSKVVILKHMFTAEEIESDPGTIIDLKEEIRSECEKLGEVSSVMVFDKSEDGVCSVKFKEDEAAEACVSLMNGRFFGGRKVEAEIYDGKSKYKSRSGSDEAEDAERLEKFAKWLEGRD